MRLSSENDLMLTSPSARLMNPSRLVAAFRATAVTSKGSNLALSSSFAILRATFVPSACAGGARTPPAKAADTASLMRVVERVRYEDSKSDRERMTRIVSGLQDVSKSGGGEIEDVPLLRLGVRGICMHSDLPEEGMEQPEQSGIPYAQSLL